MLLKVFLFLIVGASYYHYDDFSTVPSGWTFNLKYGRGGVRNALDSNGTNLVTSGVLRFQNVVVENLDYLGTWCGIMAKYETSFNPTPENPVGFEIKRVRARIDPQDETGSSGNYGDDNPESWRHVSAMSIWLVQHSSSVFNGADDGTSFPNQILLYDMMRDVWNTNASGEAFSSWGTFVSAESRINLSSLEDPTGGTVDLSNYLEFDYEDNWGYNTGNGSEDGTQNLNCTNNNVITIRVVHDGTAVRFYVNPDPNNVNSYPNTFVLLREVPVTWNTDVRFMLGVESKRYDTEMEYVDFDDFLIRTVASSITAEITPYEVATNYDATFYVAVRGAFSPNDAGIGEIFISKPDGYPDFDLSHVYVYRLTNNSGTWTVSKTYSVLVGDQNPPVDSVYVSTNKLGWLKVRLCKSSSSSNDVLSSSEEAISIGFKITSPSTPDNVGKQFVVYVENEKYDDSGNDVPHATVGRTRAYVGNAIDFTDLGLKDSDTLTVKTFDQPQAFASVEPELVYEGSTNTFYYYISTENQTGRPYITRVKILIPDEFDVLDGYFDSLLLTNESESIWLTNISGERWIWIDYSKEGKKIPSPSGIDRVSFRAVEVSNIVSETNFVWKSTVFVSIPGLSEQWTTTNSNYPRQYVTVRELPPDAYAYITPSQVYNTTKTNVYQYVIQNDGNTGNNIEKVKIVLPDMFTNAGNISSSIIGTSGITYDSSSNTITIDYLSQGTNIPAGTNDVITFTLWDKAESLSETTNASVTFQADNGNGDGWVDGQESPVGWSVEFVCPPVSAKTWILSPYEEDGDDPLTYYHEVYTTLTSQTYTYKILNDGGEDNDIFIAEIKIPTNKFTNVQNISSLHIADDTANIELSNAGEYRIIKLLYYKDSNGRLKNGEEDTITFTLFDVVTNPQVVSLPCDVANGTNSSRFTNAQPYTPNNYDISFIWPRVKANAWVKVPDGFIDSSTATNTITYYITNTGADGNKIYWAKIYLADFVSTNVIDITSEKAGSYVAFVPSGNYIYVKYWEAQANGAGSLVNGGERDKITFKMIDHINGVTNFDMTCELSNDRMISNVPPPPGESQNVVIQNPPVMLSFKVNPNVIFVNETGEVLTDTIVLMVSNRGTGGNDIDLGEIVVPSAFAGRVLYAESSWLGRNSDSDPSIIVVSETNVLIKYSNSTFVSNLSAQSVDEITLKLSNDISGQLTAGWEFRGDNDLVNPPGLTNADLWSGGDTNLYVVYRPKSSVTPNEIITTTESNDFSVTIRNGLAGGRSVIKARILIPWPFNLDNYQASSGWTGAVVSTNAFGTTNVVEIDYSANPLSAGANDIVSLTLKDDWYEGQTNVRWQVQVDYGDGSGWKDSAEYTNNAMLVVFKHPPAESVSWSQPNTIPEDYESYSYSVYIVNTGDEGNAVKMARIYAPSFITNITHITSAILGWVEPYYDSSSNRIVLDYFVSNTNIPAGMTDVITFIGYDDVDAGNTNESWQIEVANITNESSLVSSPVATGRSLDLLIYHPNYSVQFYVSATNSISDSQEDEYKVWSVGETNVIEYHIYNTGGTGNDLEKLKIYIPDVDTVFITNDISVSSSRGGADISVSNGVIWVDYTNSLKASESDVLTIKVRDKIEDGEYTTTWNSESVFSTTAGKWKTNKIFTGRTNIIRFVMPQPDAVYSVSPNEVYNSISSLNLTVNVSNTGWGTHRFYSVKIIVPSYFTNGFDSSKVSSLLATNKSVSGGEVLLVYGDNFLPGSNDTITLNLTNTFTGSSNFAIPVLVSNNPHTAYAVEKSSGLGNLNVVYPPSRYVTPNELYTTFGTNTIYITIRNDGGGSRDIVRAKVILPSLFTNIQSVDSVKVTNESLHVSVAGNIITVDYGSDLNTITPGENDVLTVIAEDNFDWGITNVEVDVQADDGVSGFLPTRIAPGQSSELSFVMPSANAEAKLMTKLIYTDTDITNVEIFIWNKGTGTDAFDKVRITVPGIFTDILVGFTNWYGVSSYSLITQEDGSYLFTIDYPDNSRIMAGESDRIEFIGLVDNVDVNTNVQWKVEVCNNPSGNFVQASPPAGDNLNMTVDFPPTTIFAYIETGDTTYTLITNSSLSYKVVNRAKDSYVDKLILNFDFSIFTNVSVESVRGGTVTILTESNKIVVDYDDSSKLGYNERDYINIDYCYFVSSATSVTLDSMVNVSGVTNLTNFSTSHPLGTTIVLKIEEPLWGKVIGYVKPTNYQISVRMLYPETETIAYNPDGEPLSAVVDPKTGRYEIAFVPPYTYHIEFSDEHFRTTYVRFVSVSSNQIVNVSEVTMRNAPFNKDAPSQQSACSVEDSLTRIEVPPGALDREFSVDFYRTPFSQPQKSDARSNPLVKTPSSPDELMAYFLDIRSVDDVPLTEMELQGDVILTLHFEDSEISKQGWNKKSLAVFYWKENANRWVRLGGVVDENSNTVSVKVGHLHRYYAVMEKGQELSGPIRNVVASPNPFTPQSSSDFNRVKLSFEFDREYDSYEVRIYDMRGRLIREIKRDGKYVQGEVSWDGLDKDGRPVRSGVYVYEIKAGGNVYRGSIVLVR